METAGATRDDSHNSRPKLLKPPALKLNNLPAHYTRWKKLSPFGISLTDYRSFLKQRKTGEYQTSFQGRPLYMSAPQSYLHSLEELFADEVYRFATDNPAPYIIDCGANWGLSIIYFKKLYPGAKILAFEPDEAIAAILEKNMASFGYEDVQLRKKAVWHSATTLQFSSDHSLGGHLTHNSETATSSVATVDLLPYLQEQPIDFLKLDIEGAEYEVLRHCAPGLSNVARIFVEYHSRPGEKQMLPELLTILRDAGFTLYIKEAAINKKHPFLQERLPYFYDMQLNIFGTR